MRVEIVGLRDTSPQFDMSLEHSVERMEERTGRVEIRTAPYALQPTAVSQSEEPQPLGLR